MGLFDYVNVRVNCPICGKPIEDFQSKDGPCYLSVIDPQYITEFYTSCDHCKTWIQYTRFERVNIIPEARKTPFNQEEISELGFHFVENHPWNNKEEE